MQTEIKNGLSHIVMAYKVKQISKVDVWANFIVSRQAEWF
jgi:hypothetical protein